MTMTRLSLALSVAAAVLAGAVSAQTEAVEQGSITLKPRTERRWDLQLPEEKFSPVGTTFDLSKSLGGKFAVKREGTNLCLDTDGDGKQDVKLSTNEGLVTFRGKDSRYSVRLVDRGGWKFGPATTMRGKLNDVRIRLIDQNNNGRFDDIGEDALIVGNGRFASYLSKVVNVGGKLFEITPNAQGTRIDYAPYAGKTGTLKLACSTKAKVMGAVVRSIDRRYSFNLGAGSETLTVPADAYGLIFGRLVYADHRVNVRAGRSRPLTVEAGSTLDLSWGGPVLAEFAYLRRGDEIKFSPEAIWYYGSAGEEYVGWTPNGKSPNISITHRKTGREIAQAYFPGSC